MIKGFGNELIKGSVLIKYTKNKKTFVFRVITLYQISHQPNQMETIYNELNSRKVKEIKWFFFSIVDLFLKSFN